MCSRHLGAAGAETTAPNLPVNSGRAGLITIETPVADAFLLLATSTAEEAARRVKKLGPKATAEDLHKLRVSLRRLRSLWWAYEPLLHKKDAKVQCREFKSLADAAGRTREWDVLRELLTAAGQSTEHSFTSIIQLVDGHRTDALSFSLGMLENAGVERILNQAVAGARRQLGAAPVSLPLARFAEQRATVAEKALKKRVKRAGSASQSDYASFHEVRIAGKKLRYVLEFFSPVLDGSRQALIEHLTSVQVELGTLNDLVTSEALVREYAFQLGGAKLVNEAVGYLQDQKVHRMNHVHQTLRAAG